MSAVDTLRALAATNSRTEKEQIILDAWMKGERDLFTGAQMAYDILMPFRVQKVALIENPDPKEPHNLPFAEFKKLAMDLHNRVVTGNAAKAAIDAAAMKSNGVIWNDFYRRVLLKDFKAGVTDGTFNKVLEKLAKSDKDAAKYIVPVFECQLAKDGADGTGNEHRVSGKKMLDIKLDGVRLLTVVDKEAGTVTQFTRNGKQNDNFPHIRAAFEVLLTMPDVLPCSMVFDGEITSKSFQTLMTQVNRTRKTDTSDTKLALFDMLPLADFKHGISNVKQSDRHTALCGVIGLMLHLSGEVYVVPKLTVDLDTPEGKKAFNEFNTEAIAAGYEGIMVKDPDAPYECRRAFHWLKVKPFIEVSLTAKDIKPGEKGTKFEHSMGAVLFEGEEDGKKISVWCGGGFTPADRDEIWNNWKKYKGMIGEVKADCFSLEQGATVYSLRFPRFKGWRGHKKGEKI